MSPLCKTLLSSGACYQGRESASSGPGFGQPLYSHAAAENKAGCVGLGLLLVASMFLLPMYLYPSGGFQVADLPLMLTILVVLLSRLEKTRFFGEVAWGVPFLLWVILVNSIQYLLKEDLWNIKGTGIMLYGPTLAFSFAIAFFTLLKKGDLKWPYLGFLGSIAGCFVAKGYSETGRAALSFNDPNQLGYFAAIMLGSVLIIRGYRERLSQKSLPYDLLDGVIILVAHIFLALSLSRSAMVAFFFLDLLLLKDSFKSLWKLFALLIVLAWALIYLTWLNPDFLQKRAASRPEHFKKEGILKNLKIRITKPLEYMSPLELVVGTGAGIQFQTRTGTGAKGEDVIEVHNMFVDIFRSYGLVGLLLFLPWLIKLIWDTRRAGGSLWVWTAMLVYNMGNNGIRFRSLWILMGLILAVAALSAQGAASKGESPKRRLASVELTNPTLTLERAR